MSLVTGAFIVMALGLVAVTTLTALAIRSSHQEGKDRQ